MHGKVRGLDQIPHSTSFEGRFGRLFRTLPKADFTDEALKDLIGWMNAALEEDESGGMDMDEEKVDDEENDGIDAGYTYLGQFIDHDLTFDPASSFQKQNDPDALIDFRSPRFDLDSVYGRGPDDQPYMYAADGLHLLEGTDLEGGENGARDLIRIITGKGRNRAVIGDPRNDENVIVSQLQGLFIRFHNKVASQMLKEAEGTRKRIHFEDVARVVRWHYQWIVLHDFLPLIVGQDMINSILPDRDSAKSLLESPPKFQVYSYKKEPFIPVEFSVAAYRFGHSMIRPFYRLNTNIIRAIFAEKEDSRGLNGFDSFPSDWGINWDLFFDPGGASRTGKGRIQKSYKLDTSLVNPLAKLPASVVARHRGDDPAFRSLAYRNLKRGVSFGLPSGQAVARFLGIKPLADNELRVSKTNAEDQTITAAINEVNSEFTNNAPLWFYILAEAEQEQGGHRLGNIGGRLVAETFIGLLAGDSSSFINQDPKWMPDAPIASQKGKFGMRDLINFVFP